MVRSYHVGLILASYKRTRGRGRGDGGTLPTPRRQVGNLKFAENSPLPP
ncbi:hypothetical protein [Microseira wollei]|nr:hypothetical protein [Microseira wollei]